MGIAHLMLGNVASTGPGKPRIRDIHIEASPTTDSLIYYSCIENNSILVIDAQVNGITCAELIERITISAYNGTATFAIRTDEGKPTSLDTLVATGFNLWIRVKNSSYGGIEYVYPIAMVGDVGTPTYIANTDGTYKLAGSSGVGDGKSLYKGSNSTNPDPEDDCLNISSHYLYNIEYSPVEYLAVKKLDSSNYVGSSKAYALLKKNQDLASYLQQYTTSICEHEGGTATCSQLAICTKCGSPYGEFLDHVYPTVTSNDIQWTGSDGTPCTSAYLSVNCLTCGGATISEYGELIIKEYDPEGCGGTEDCYARFEHELFRGVNPARCKFWHTELHTNYTAIGTVGGLDCLDEIMNKLCCECGEHIEYTGSGKYGPHEWDSWSAISGENKHARSCMICHAYEEGGCVMSASSISYTAAPNITNEHWVNGTCEECGRQMTYSEPCEFDDGNVCWMCNCEPH